jgi:hypothetical protein
MAFNRTKKNIQIDQDYIQCDRCVYAVSGLPRTFEVTDNSYPIGWARIAGINPSTQMPVVMDLCDLCAPEAITFIRNNPRQRAGSQTA